MRAEVVYIGRVQGVGFRATAHHLANEHSIAGWIRNEADGRVRLVAEADAESIDAFLIALQERMGRFITDEQITRSGETRGYAGFEIRC